MKSAGTIRWLKWELSEFETYDLEVFLLMLLRNSNGSYWALLTSCKVCVELQWASLMPSVASAPGFNVVTSPVETGLFGFSQLHQRSQSIFILHGYPLSQQHLIKRLNDTPNLSKFGIKWAWRLGCNKKIADNINVEKFHWEVFWGLPQCKDGCNGFTWQRCSRCWQWDQSSKVMIGFRRKTP